MQRAFIKSALNRFATIVYRVAFSPSFAVRALVRRIGAASVVIRSAGRFASRGPQGAAISLAG